MGSALATTGLAGCALAQVGNVGPDLGQNYIIDAFLVVVVGGVGQIWGAVLAALGLGVGGTVRLRLAWGCGDCQNHFVGTGGAIYPKRPQGLFCRFIE